VTSHGIDSLYFDYRPAAGHLESCLRRGTDAWEVTRHVSRSYGDDDKSEVTIRLACHDCGVVHFESARSENLSTEIAHGSEIGYGSRPERVAGLWLWPGPRIWHGDGRGPTVYLITATKDRPTRPEDVLGKVGWCLGRRGGIHWSAGVGCGRYGSVLEAAEQTWPSRRAAVAWVAEKAWGSR
jgi:hypothetical protein